MSTHDFEQPLRKVYLMSDSNNLLAQLLDAYNSHDTDKVLFFFTDDAVFVSPVGPGPDGRHFTGKDEIREAVASRFKASPDVHWEAESHIVAATRGASSWLVTWTGEDGTKIAKRGCDLFDIRGDKVSRKDSFFKEV
jgi:ketosteroid isomerase-like protein